MKRAMSGKTRRGAPPLPRQRKALRITQLTLVALAGWLGWLANEQWGAAARNVQAIVVLAILALLSLASAAWMGLRTIRGPEPPQLD